MSTVGTPGSINQAPPTSGFLGQGVTYPPQFTAQGRLKISSGTTSVEEALKTILETAPGERPMLPGYGARIGEFEPIDMARMIAKFKRDVQDYEPRVESIDSFNTSYGPGVGEVVGTITYTLVGEANERVLTYPFFTGPA